MLSQSRAQKRPIIPLPSLAPVKARMRLGATKLRTTVFPAVTN